MYYIHVHVFVTERETYYFMMHVHDQDLQKENFSHPEIKIQKISPYTLQEGHRGQIKKISVMFF